MDYLHSDDKSGCRQPDNVSYRWMEIAVPFFSFGGAAIAMLFQVQGIFLDFRISAFGCVLASCFLAYLAWIRPKKDIVALSTPIYSFIFFIVPTDAMSGIILQLLYAVSLTILLVRLRLRFGRPGQAITDKKELAGPLMTYTERTRDVLIGTRPDTAHRATLAFVRFAQGEYEEAAQVSGTETGKGDSSVDNPTLARAFAIIREHALLLDQSLPRPESYLTFLPEDASLLQSSPRSLQDREHECDVMLDNALLLLFSAAWNASEQDRPHLLACQAFAQKLMSSP